MYVCRVIWVNNKLLAGQKCDISVCVCAADIFKHRDYLVRGKSVFTYCGIILLTRPDYTFSRRATFSPDAFIITVRSFIAMQMPDSEYNSVARKIWVLLKTTILHSTAVLRMFKEQSGNSLINKFKRQKLIKRYQESVDM